MSSVKFFFKSISNRIFSLIFIFLQLIISAYCLMTLFSMIFGVPNLINKVDKKLPIERSFKVQIPSSAAFDTKESEKVSERMTLLKYLINNKNIDKTGIVIPSDIPFCYSYEKNKYYDVLSKTSKSELDIFARDSISAYQVDKYFYKLFNIKVQEGRGFNAIDFANANYAEMPVIAGDSFKGIYKINDKIMVSKDYSYKIIGFLPKGFTMYTDGNVVGAMKKIDSSLIEPMVYDQTSAMVENAFGGRFIFSIKATSNLQNTVSDIRNEIKKLGIKIDIVSFLQDIEDFKENSSSVLTIEIIENVVLIIFSISGLIASIMANINARKKEFGILMAYGASFLDVFTIIFKELVVILTLAYIISAGLFFKLGSRIYENQLPNSFGFYNFGLGFLSLLFLLLISGTIAFCSVIRLKPIELIGGFRE